MKYQRENTPVAPSGTMIAPQPQTGVMNLQPKEVLTEQDKGQGLKMVIGDGLSSEAMTTLTGGAFIVAMAILLGANNVQLGLIAALPTRW